MPDSAPDHLDVLHKKQIQANHMRPYLFFKFSVQPIFSSSSSTCSARLLICVKFMFGTYMLSTFIWVCREFDSKSV